MTYPEAAVIITAIIAFTTILLRVIASVFELNEGKSGIETGASMPAPPRPRK